ncbi:MAG: ABC transporter ATP-binding protein [Dehalococcoidia bacterium]|jgi:iron(III) transport system ATP-binding protein|nr:ABC transporter ATP-binding protein [Chloroflexota bacterium]MDP6055922.1 ABC transporter ATP-binding protein [Dehalococcoidia bacterium]|tara:strand:+ start:1896 stop:3065 length:1170 start_codon:yes stop_codon:yes gene_type:complete
MRVPWRRKPAGLSVPTASATEVESGTSSTPTPLSEETGVIHLQGVECRYLGSDTPAISDFNLLVRPGEFVSILGRSGAGKTTALRVIAGFEQVSDGYIRIGGKLVGTSFVHVPPDQRRIGLVFQDYALFPHLTVAKNIEFGLKDLPADERRVRIAPVLKMVGMSGYESRYVHELSGGQQQRVAIARALAPDPVALLLDEPFSNLDRQLRAALRRDIKKIVHETGATTLLVTHDREEALATSDRIAVMGDNCIEQIGTPEDVYQNPISAAVARLIGPCELIPGVYRGEVVVTEAGVFPVRVTTENSILDGRQVLALMRASELEIELAGEDDQRTAMVEAREFEGEFSEYSIRLDSGTLLRVRRRAANGIELGSRVTVCARDGSKVIVFPA